MLVLSQLPAVAFCETDTAAVERAIIADYETVTGRTLYPGEPERLFLEAVAYLIAQQRYLIDYTGKMNLLSLSRGGFLDHLGALLSTKRLGRSASITTLKFTASGLVTWDIPIPQGTRARAGGGDGLIWATQAEVIIPAGQTEASALALCQTPGAVGNGYTPGQINRLVDSVGYVSGVANTTLTLGGTDVETDERLRLRAQLAPERLSVAGPTGAYRYHALSVSQEIIDVAVWSPEPGKVRLAPLVTGGEPAGAELIALVFQAVNGKSTRPLTDKVTVVAPEKVEYSIAGTFQVLAGYAAQTASVAARVEAAVKSFIAWQKEKLGRQVNPSELAGRIQNIEGVHRVELTQPAYRGLEPWEVAHCTASQVLYGGLADD